MPRLDVNAVVTGSTRGLGYAIAAALREAGANVVINGRTEAACEAAIARMEAGRGEISYVAGAVESESTVRGLVETCVNSFGSVDFVVNNAGITRDKSLLNMTADEFDEVVAVHLRGTWLMCREAARAMTARGGTILNVTSGSALFGLVGQSNYAAAKGGVNALTRALSVELARYDIRVNALYPVALTDMTAPMLAMTGGESSPLRSVFGDPAHVAKLAIALASPQARSITGQIIGFGGTEMSVWTHPERAYQFTHDAPWTHVDAAGALAHLAEHPAPLNPDQVGARTRAALTRRRHYSDGYR